MKSAKYFHADGGKAEKKNKRVEEAHKCSVCLRRSPHSRPIKGNDKDEDEDEDGAEDEDDEADESVMMIPFHMKE